MGKLKHPVSLDRLRGFRAAARHLSFTLAAQELHVTQSAISREIKALESQLGKPLFRRVHRALQLTRDGEELYRVTDEALASLDAVTRRLAESATSLAVTTTTALASLWLAPRLPRFTRLHPGVDVRIAAKNGKPDLEREQMDVAIQFVPHGGDVPDGEVLLDVDIFPVCAPSLLRNGPAPLREPADLAQHVRLDFETIRDGRPWSEWNAWFAAMKLPHVQPATTLRFSHYDHVIPAVIEGSGVAMGCRPHLTHHLREGLLCAPFGEAAAATLGNFHAVVRRDVAGSDSVEAFLAWVRSEIRRDGEITLAAPNAASRPSAQGAAPRTRAKRS